MEALENTQNLSANLHENTLKESDNNLSSLQKNEMNEKYSKKNHHQEQNSYSVKNHKDKKNHKVSQYTVQQILYQAEMYLLLRHPYLIGLNKKNEGIANKLDINSKFIMIKCAYEEDVHKAIKYNIWSSTIYGNGMLNDRYNSALENNSDVYLFFSCDNSRVFLGVAKLQSGVDKDKVFPLWTNKKNQPGLFSLEWVFIKDVPFYVSKEILVPLYENVVKPVHLLKNTQEIPYSEGKRLMERVDSFNNTNTILEHFEHYDMRQENYERMFPNSDNK